MKSLMRILWATFVGMAAVLVSSSKVSAERIGGPFYTLGTIPAYQSVFFDIPFYAGRPAAVAVAGQQGINLELVIYEGDGNILAGSGSRESKTALWKVYRAGIFRIEIRNNAPVANTIEILTN